MDININSNIILFGIFIFILYYWFVNGEPKKNKFQPFYGNIEELTINNTHYRKVLSTTNNMQLVIMSLLPNQDIGMEIHPNTTQFIRIEKGKALAIMDSKKSILRDGDVVVVPPGANHNIINISNNERLQLYAIYTPPEHPPKTLQHNKPKHHDH
tara:strand:+ start:1474 stop:1938 length:465 start_codon:yes stop_codon:yes gene_type:complete